MASGTAKVIRGSFIGTGLAIDIKTVGFRPRSVELHNVTDKVSAKWTTTMADASMCLWITDGTMTFEVADGITPLADGFTVGANADLNATAEVVHWEAIE